MCRSSSNHQTTGRHDLGTLGALASKLRSTRRRDEKNEKAGAGSESDVGGDAMEEGYKALGPKVQQFKRSREWFDGPAELLGRAGRADCDWPWRERFRSFRRAEAEIS